MEAFEAQVAFCYTADLQKTARFYEEMLGLPLVLDQGACRIYRTSTSSFIGVCECHGSPEPSSIILTLVTQDVDGWYRRLSSKGVRFEKEPAANPRFNIYHCFLRDPNGYLIEIQRFEDPRWPVR